MPAVEEFNVKGLTKMPVTKVIVASLMHAHHILTASPHLCDGDTIGQKLFSITEVIAK